MEWFHYALFGIDLVVVLVLIGLLVLVKAVICETGIVNVPLLARSGDHHKHNGQEAE